MDASTFGHELRHVPSEQSRFDSPHVEILAPVRPAYDFLNDLIEGGEAPAGAEVCVSDVGTLVLNQCAWMHFGDRLRQVPYLTVRQSFRSPTQPIRFLLHTG